MLVNKEIVKQEILNFVNESFKNKPITLGNILNISAANYIIKNNIDKYLKHFILDDDNININSIETEFLARIDEVRKENPSLIGANGELARIPMINLDFIVTEQEVRDLIINIKNKSVK